MFGLGINHGSAAHAPWWPPDAVFAIDFVTGLAMRDNVARPLHDLIEFSRPSPRFGQDSAGRWHLFAANVPAITDLGIHIEPAAANLVNSSNGPTGWDPARLTLSAGKPDPVAGASACRVTVTGEYDPIVTQELDLSPLAGRTFTHSIFARCHDAQGMTPGIGMLDYDAALAEVQMGAFAIDGSWRRYANTFTFGSVIGSRLLTRLDPFNPQGDTVAAGAVIDVWGWQVEEAAHATSPIGDFTRAADSLKLSLPAAARHLHLLLETGAQHNLTVAGGLVDVSPSLPAAIIRAWALP